MHFFWNGADTLNSYMLPAKDGTVIIKESDFLMFPFDFQEEKKKHLGIEMRMGTWDTTLAGLKSRSMALGGLWSTCCGPEDQSWAPFPRRMGKCLWTAASVLIARP